MSPCRLDVNRGGSPVTAHLIVLGILLVEALSSAGQQHTCEGKSSRSLCLPTTGYCVRIVRAESMAMHVISCRSARTSCSARAMSSTARCFSGLTSGDKSMRCLAKTPLAVPTSLSWSAQVAAGQYAISAAHNRCPSTHKVCCYIHKSANPCRPRRLLSFVISCTSAGIGMLSSAPTASIYAG